MIVATAGHIDHGKTALVQALTGIDADRLPEEKRRGMTIDLGFAYWPVEAGLTVGFVDVPGHEKFVRTMLAGVAGIDLALLVVAADDGPMPQTREHLAILDLMAVPAGAVVVTKADRVSAERLAEVEQEIRAATRGTCMADAPLWVTSAYTGQGVADLKAWLLERARGLDRPAVSGHFRLAVDRAFTLQGAGLVVTGTAVSGEVHVGDRLLLSPLGREVRVRSLHAQNAESDTGRERQRLALNLVGVDKDLVRRGDWILAPAVHAPTDRIDVCVRVAAGEGLSLGDRQPVHVHLGAADVTGRLALLEGRRLEPGESGWAQLVLDHAVGALAGDRFVLRDQSARLTLGGGRVVDPFPPARGRRAPERLAFLAALDRPDRGAALAAALAASPNGLDLGRFALAHNLMAAERETLTARLDARTAAGLSFSPEHAAGWVERVRAALTRWHEDFRDRAGAPPESLRRTLTTSAPRPTWAAALALALADGVTKQVGPMVALVEHEATMAHADRVLWEELEPLLLEGGLRPPRVRELAASVGEEPVRIEAVLRRAANLALVAPVAKNRFFPPPAIEALVESARQLAADQPDGRFTAQQYKDATGIGRNVAIEVLEYFDRAGITRRRGDTRILL
ncbi:MAG: selenocysteine-specific translation elongation factor [Alphaproteobacteria bacterium]|nr:selenocysteine-specific translation elongation factor [Alphaproteobacteria bacterium]